jgi:hypothetical protein
MKYMFLLYGPDRPFPQPGTDLDEALKWAAALPTAADGSVEIHPVIEVVAPS